MSRKEPKVSDKPLLVLKDLLREKYPETYEWLYEKSQKPSASPKKTS